METVQMGAFATRRKAVNEAKSNLFSHWFVLVGYADGSWDFASATRSLPANDRTTQIMYQRSRSTGNWYTTRS